MHCVGIVYDTSGSVVCLLHNLVSLKQSANLSEQGQALLSNTLHTKFHVSLAAVSTLSVHCGAHLCNNLAAVSAMCLQFPSRMCTLMSMTHSRSAHMFPMRVRMCNNGLRAAFNFCAHQSASQHFSATNTDLQRPCDTVVK